MGVVYRPRGLTDPDEGSVLLRRPNALEDGEDELRKRDCAVLQLEVLNRLRDRTTSTHLVDDVEMVYEE